MSRLFNKFAAVLVALSAASAGAADFSFTGTLPTANSRQNFDFTILSDATVTMRSLGYAGGVNQAGTTIVKGGFDTQFFLFGVASGALIDFNDDSVFIDGDGFPVCVSAIDPDTDECYDSGLTAALGAGSYRLVLTAYNNDAIGLIDDSFTCEGEDDFNGRTGDFAFDIRNVDSVTSTTIIVLPDRAGVVPEPASWALLIAGFGMTGSAMRRRRRAAVA